MFENVKIEAAWTNVAVSDLVAVATTMDALGLHREIKDGNTAVLKISHIHPAEKAGNHCAFVNLFTKEIVLSSKGKGVARHELTHFLQEWGGPQWSRDRSLPWAMKEREMEADVVSLLSFAPKWALDRFKEKGYTLLEAAGVCRIIGCAGSFDTASRLRLTVSAVKVALLPKNAAMKAVKAVAARRAAWYEAAPKRIEESDFYQFYKELMAN